MREEKRDLEPDVAIGSEVIKYSEVLSMDYCGFRLKALAQKIKSECLKFKKAETRLTNP